MNNPPARIASASLEWRDGQPLSTTFGDVYYSLDNGLAETRHVFLEGNDLPARWACLAPDSDFVIVETGFGSGLNFLAAASLWLTTAPPDARLHFVSCEKFPLRRSDLRQALAAWPELAALASELGDAYPPLVPGFHRRWLGGGRIALTLIFDDAISGLESLCASDHPAFAHCAGAKADAWFLDGFAPAKNPDLWSPQLFALAAQLSRPGTTVATFTVARQVRDGLSNAGFTFAKAPGFGRKRDMLTGVFAKETFAEALAGECAMQSAEAEPQSLAPTPVRRTTAKATPWFLPPPAHRGAKRALVVGGGIAGCTSAAALQRRGWQVTIVERHGQLGAEASGNPQGILYQRLSVEDLALSELGRQALCHAMDYYRPWWQQPASGQRSGVLVLPESARDREHFPRIAERYREADELVKLVTGDELSALAGVPLEADMGLWFANLGWVAPPLVCQALAAGTELIKGEVAALELDENSGEWQLFDDQARLLACAPVVILAGAYSIGRYTQTQHLPLRLIRGQISAFAATPASAQLNAVICGSGYVAPAREGMHTLGATYEIDSSDTAVRDIDHQCNLDTLAATDPRLPALFSDSPAGGRAALRCTTPDYLPVTGPAPHFESYVQCYSELRRNAKATIAVPGPCWQGLWINAGHGSRGLTYAPLAAELIASQICGEPAPLPRRLAGALHPGRFIIRDLKRNKIAVPPDDI